MALNIWNIFMMSIMWDFIFWCCLCNISQRPLPLFVVIKEYIIERNREMTYLLIHFLSTACFCLHSINILSVRGFTFYFQLFWPRKYLTKSFKITHGCVYMCMLFFCVWLSFPPICAFVCRNVCLSVGLCCRFTALINHGAAARKTVSQAMMHFTLKRGILYPGPSILKHLLM